MNDLMEEVVANVESDSDGVVMNKPSCGVSRLPTVFLAKKLSKYRLKQPKYIVLGTPKKPDKTPKKMAKIDFE